MMNVVVLWTIILRIFHKILTLWGDPKKTGRMGTGLPFACMELTVIKSDKNLVVTLPMTSIF
jgi:hypothetical protein